MPILTILIVWPVVAGLVLVFVPQIRAYSREVALGATLAELVMAVGLLATFDRSDAGAIQFTEKYSWIPQIGASWAVGVNGIGLTLIVLATLLTPLAVLAAWREDDALDRRAQYLGLILLTEA